MNVRGSGDVGRTCESAGRLNMDHVDAGAQRNVQRRDKEGSNCIVNEIGEETIF